MADGFAKGGFAQGIMFNRQSGLEAERNRTASRTADIASQQLVLDQQQESRKVADDQIKTVLESLQVFGQILNQAEASGKSVPAYQQQFDQGVEVLRQLYAKSGRQQLDVDNIAQAIRGKAQLEAGKGKFIVGNRLLSETGQNITTIPKEIDVSAETGKIATLATGMLDKGLEPGAISAVLDTLATDVPELSQPISAIKNSLPVSQEAYARGMGERDIAKAQPQIEELTSLGVDQKTAAMLVLGRAGASLLLGEAGAGELSPKEKAELRTDILTLRDTSTALRSARTKIDADTVGLWGAISEKYGGILQQIPAAKQIADTLGASLGLDEKTVNKAITTRNEFRFLIGQLAQFITQKGGRLSNQDRDFVQQATGLEWLATTPKAAAQTIDRLIDIADNLERNRSDILSGGDILSGSQAGGTAPTAAQRSSYAQERDIPEGTIVHDKQTGQTLIKRGGALVPYSP